MQERRLGMNKLFSTMMGVLILVFLCSISLAGEIERDGTLDTGMEASTPTAIADHNYISEVFASDVSGNDGQATKVFSQGDTVYLVTRYYVASPGNTTRYRILSDVSGAIKGMYISSYTTTTGKKYNTRAVTGLSAGVYYFTTVILSPGNHMISPDGYLFVVE